MADLRGVEGAPPRRTAGISALLAQAEAARAAEQPRSAIPPLLAAVQAAPENAGLRLRLAEVLYDAGLLPQAAGMYRTVLAQAPKDASAASGLALVLERTGELEQAEALVEPFVREAGPCHTNVLTVWATVCRRTGRAGEAVPVLESALLETRRDSERIVLSYVLGECLHELGHPDAAFEAYRTANELRRESYDPAVHTREVDGLIEVFSADGFRRRPVATRRSERPLLIVGMMRSGSTLVEGILARHRDVFAGGERPILDAARDVVQKIAREPWPACVERLTQAQVDEVSALYLQELGRDAADHQRRVTDKLLANYLLLGLAAQLLPAARVIHCVRDPLDTGLSCYFKNFAVAHPYSTRLEWIGHRVREHDRLMAHWKRCLPLPIHTVRYEQLVESPEREARALLEFCELGWDEACLRPEETQRAVLTASYAQVLQPISKRGVGRATPYKHWLGPLHRAVDPDAS